MDLPNTALKNYKSGNLLLAYTTHANFETFFFPITKKNAEIPLKFQDTAESTFIDFVVVEFANKKKNFNITIIYHSWISEGPNSTNYRLLKM